MAKAVQGLLDHSLDLDKRIELILKEIEALRADTDSELSATRWGDRKVAGK
jgi:hypothetical protein